MVTAFAAGGLVDLVPALAVMLGATLIVQVLSFDASRVSFLLILIGVFMFRRSAVTRKRDLGRVGIAHQTGRQLFGSQPAGNPRNAGPADEQCTGGGVFMTEDPRAVRRLLGEKEVFREIETHTTEEYFGGACTDRSETIEMSKLLLDIVSDLKRVNAHLAAAAYPILEGHGELLPSRLKQD
jgi:Na+/phosphate symporter